MTQLLAVDGLAYRVLSGWVAMVRAGLIWLLCSLPVVTAPAATLVLLRTVREIAGGADGPSLAESLRLVRSSLWPALRLAGLLAVGYAVVVTACFGPSPGGPWDVTLPVVVLPIAATWVLVSQWALPVLEERADGAWNALKYAYLRTIRRPDLALVSGVGAIALLAIGIVLPSALWLPYWLTVPALWAALVTVTSRQAAVAARAGRPAQ